MEPAHRNLEHYQLAQVVEKGELSGEETKDMAKQPFDKEIMMNRKKPIVHQDKRRIIEEF
jgi:hypothetical protein